MIASRQVYLHFLDRELLTTLGLYQVIQEQTAMSDLVLLLHCTYEPHYFSMSLAFENRFARAAITRFPSLFRAGHIRMIMREYNLEDFVHNKKAQYEYAPENYPFYFDDTWKVLEDIGLAIVHRSMDTTRFLEKQIIKEIQGEGLAATANRLQVHVPRQALERLKPHVEESILTRGNKAITKKLYEGVYDRLGATSSIRRVYDLKISENYVKSYIAECGGTIATGIQSGVDYFAYLCPTYPCHHLPYWKMVYQKMGLLPYVRNLAKGDVEILAIRETPEFIRFVEGVRGCLGMSVDKGDGIARTSGHPMPLATLLESIPTINRKPKDFNEILGCLVKTTRAIGECSYEKQKVTRRRKMKVDSKKVFVVYGRDEKKRKAIFDILRSAHLEPMEWEQIVKLTGKGSPYVGEVLDKGFEVAQAIVVLFTGDDMASLRPELLNSGEATEEPTPQPRPNVILEAGMAIGKQPERTVIVQLGSIRNISDLSGRHVIHLKNDVPSRKKLLTRLQTAKCAVNLEGDDWLTAGEL